MALISAACLPSTGCYLNQQTHLRIIEREAAVAEARADENLEADLHACAGDPECRNAALQKHARTMREIQATRDARVDAELERDRGR